MKKANETQASEKQRQFIEALAKKNKVRVEKPLEELSFTEASELIDNLKKIGEACQRAAEIEDKDKNGKAGQAKPKDSEHRR